MHWFLYSLNKYKSLCMTIKVYGIKRLCLTDPLNCCMASCLSAPSEGNSHRSGKTEGVVNAISFGLARTAAMTLAPWLTYCSVSLMWLYVVLLLWLLFMGERAQATGITAFNRKWFQNCSFIAVKLRTASALDIKTQKPLHKPWLTYSRLTVPMNLYKYKSSNKPALRCGLSVARAVPRGCLTASCRLVALWYLLSHSNVGTRDGDLQTSEEEETEAT